MNSRTETPLLRGGPACQKSLAGVYRTGLANSHGAACLLRYLIYTRPDIGEQRGLFWDIPLRWIQFLRVERLPPYVLLFRLRQSGDRTEPGRQGELVHICRQTRDNGVDRKWNISLIKSAFFLVSKRRPGAAASSNTSCCSSPDEATFGVLAKA